MSSHAVIALDRKAYTVEVIPKDIAMRTKKGSEWDENVFDKLNSIGKENALKLKFVDSFEADRAYHNIYKVGKSRGIKGLRVTRTKRVIVRIWLDEEAQG